MLLEGLLIETSVDLKSRSQSLPWFQLCLVTSLSNSYHNFLPRSRNANINVKYAWDGALLEDGNGGWQGAIIASELRAR